MSKSPTFSREYEPDKNYNATSVYMKDNGTHVVLSATEGMVQMTAQAVHQMMLQLGYKLVDEERHNG